MSLSDTLAYKSPYYLDEEDPDYILFWVTLSQAEDNYVTWKLEFTSLLRVTNKLGFVDGTIKKPDPSSPLYERWERCNAIVMCWMLNSMTDELSKLVKSAETAHKMWEHLRRIFVPNVDVKIYQTRQKISKLRQGGDSVAKYFDRMNNAWLELSEYDPVKECSCGGCNCETTKRANEARDKEELYAFLMGLNKELSFVKTHIMYMMTPPPSLYQAYEMVERAESTMKE